MSAKFVCRSVRSKDIFAPTFQVYYQGVPTSYVVQYDTTSHTWSLFAEGSKKASAVSADGKRDAFLEANESLFSSDKTVQAKREAASNARARQDAANKARMGTVSKARAGGAPALAPKTWKA